MTQISKRSTRAISSLVEGLPLDFFRALGDPNRIALIAWLAQQRGPQTVSEIASSGTLAVDLSVVSRHLRTLHQAGILEVERRGREVHYQLRVESLVHVLRRIADLLESCCLPQAPEKPKKE